MWISPVAIDFCVQKIWLWVLWLERQFSTFQLGMFLTSFLKR